MTQEKTSPHLDFSLYNLIVEMDEITRYVMLGTLSISSIGCCFVCFVYWYYPTIRCFTYRLIVWISLMDLGHAIGFFIPDLSDNYCKAEAILTSYFSLAIVLRTATLSYYLHSSVKRVRENRGIQNRERYERFLEWCFGGFANGIPLLVLAIPFDFFGKSEGWCWIKDTDEYFIYGTMLRLVSFYVPLWLVVGYNVLIYSNIRGVLQRQGYLMQFPTPDIDQIVQRLRWYPWVLALCYAVPTVNRFYQIGTEGAKSDWLCLASGFSLSLCGLGNAIVYGFSESVREQMR